MKRSSSIRDHRQTSKRSRNRPDDVGREETVPKAEESEVTEQSMMETLRRLNGQDFCWQPVEADDLSLSYTMMLGKREADFLFASLESSTQYYSGELTQIKVYGKWYPIPRKQVSGSSHFIALLARVDTGGSGSFRSRKTAFYNTVAFL